MMCMAGALQDEVERVLLAGADLLSRPKPHVAAPAPRRSCDRKSSAPSILTFFTSEEKEAKPIDSDQALSEGACRNCGHNDMVLHAVDSVRQCQACDAIEYIVIENERPSKRDVPKDSTSFSFKRLSHFNEWLAQIQGRDNPSIPESVIGFVMMELRRHGVVNAADVSTSQVRTILKKLKLSRYYENAPYILSRVRGVPSERMPPALESKLRTMFRQIQVPFVRNSPPTRKNFLSYGYVLHKFVQLLGADEYLDRFPLLKSRDKLRIQDGIWKAICQDLNWEFIASV